MSKFLIAAVALLVSTGASAQSSGARQPAASARHAVLDNIIGRVQMDALIDTVVDVEVAPEGVSDTRASTGIAANIAGNTARSAHARRDVVDALDGPSALRTRG